MNRQTPCERIDDLQIDGLTMIQRRDLFCFGTDAVLLSDYVRAQEHERVLDLGTGNGIIPLLLSAKTKAAHITGIEIQSDSADLAQRNVLRNHLEERIDIMCGDIRDVHKQIKAGTYQVIVTNPPYIKKGSGLCSEDARGIARHELKITLRELMEEAGRLLIAKGRLYMVHRPQRLAEIMEEMRRVHIEPKRMRLVHSFDDKPAELVLIEGIKEGQAEMEVQSPLVLHTAPGVYSAEAARIYGISGEEESDRRHEQGS